MASNQYIKLYLPQGWRGYLTVNYSGTKSFTRSLIRRIKIYGYFMKCPNFSTNISNLQQ